MDQPLSSSPPSTRSESLLWKAAIILLAGLFIYAPVFSGGWLIDDNFELTENVAIQDPGGLARIWSGEAGADYLPLKSTVQWVLWRFFGDDTTPFHLVSIVLHLFSALLVWRLLERLGVRHAWVGGLLFVAHPLLVESVAWVSELKNTLSLAVLLLALLAWMSFEALGRRRDYAWSLALFVAALLCKAAVVMFPIVILGYAWFRRGRIDRRDVRRSLPFFAASLAAAITTVSLQSHRSIGSEIFPLGGLFSRVALTGSSLAFYFWKTVFPFRLLPMYPRWQIDPPGVVTFLPWPVLVGLTTFLWTRRRTAWGKSTLLGLGFFVLNLLPVLGLFKMSYWRISWVSDHLAYLPSLGLIGLAAAGLSAGYDRLHPGWRPPALGAAFVGAALLIGGSHREATVYADMESMTRYTLRYNPDAWLAHQLLSVACQRKGDFDGSLEHALAAARLNPTPVEVQNSLGTALMSKGRYREAILHLDKAVQRAPGIWLLHMNLAKCYVSLNDPAGALQEYRALLQHAPDDAGLHSDAGACLYRLGRLDEAIGEFRRALEINPGQPSAKSNLAAALQRQNELNQNPFR